MAIVSNMTKTTDSAIIKTEQKYFLIHMSEMRTYDIDLEKVKVCHTYRHDHVSPHKSQFGEIANRCEDLDHPQRQIWHLYA